jgi:PST family polysaccharide transporter
MLQQKIEGWYGLLKSNRKVGESYFFMTILQILNSLFYLLIYPFLIRTLGAESYGLYVFALSIVTYFMIVVSFGFDFPAVKAIAQNKDNLPVKSAVVSGVLTAKIYLLACSAALFFTAVAAIKPMREHWVLYAICFGQVIPAILLPAWYFQGMQKMRTVTAIQMAFKLLSIPFIFWLIQSPADNWLFAAIVTLTGILGGAVAMLILRSKEKIQFRIVALTQLKALFKDGLPFFWSSSAGIIKQQSITIIIGSFFSMYDVAIYDLANKIILLPQILVANINGALFPKIVNTLRAGIIRKIERYEMAIGLLAMVGIAVFGKWIALILGGASMLAAYPIAVIISLTALTGLIVGCYISFIFVPQGKYYYATRNQLVAFVSFFMLCAAGVIIFKSIWAIAAAISLSGLCEVAYCNIVIKRKKLLII